MWCRVGLVVTDVSRKPTACIISVESLSELETALAVPSNWSKLADSFHPDDGDETFFRNVRSYKSITAS
jgi:hypothetical protein